MSTLHDSCDVLRLAGAAATVSPARSADLTIRGITLDSRRVEQGFMFACVRGAHHDGHDHAGEAVERGAAMLFYHGSHSLAPFWVSYANHTDSDDEGML